MSLDFVLIAKGKYCEVLRQARMGSNVCFYVFQVLWLLYGEWIVRK